MSRDLKDILHELVDAADLSPAHRQSLHDDVDVHDDPEAQAAREQEHHEELDAEAAELEAKLAELNKRRGVAPATADEGA